MSLHYGGAWHVVPVYSRDAITINRELGDDQAEPPPAIAKLTLDDRAQRFNPENPAGPLWGLIGPNTPIRIEYPGDVRFTGEVNGWFPEQSQEFVPGADKGDAWCAIEAAGILLRTGQGTSAVPSTLRAYTDAQPGAVASFPCEDGPTARVPANVVPGGAPGAGADLSFGEADDLPASAGVMTFEEPSSYFTAPIARAGALSGFVSVVVLFRLDAVPTGRFELFRLAMTGTAAVMSLDVDGGSFFREVAAADGSILMSGNVLHQLDVTQWTAVHLGLWQSAPGVITWTFLRHQANAAVILGATGTFSGLLGQAAQFTIGPDAGKERSQWAHLLVTHQPVKFVDQSMVRAVNGWSGVETPIERIERLCADAGIPVTVEGTSDAAENMGVQRPGTLQALLGEAIRTDDGALFEPRDSLGLRVRSRTSLRAPDPALVLDWAKHELAEPFRAAVDGTGRRNDVTVTQPGGSSARSVLESGRMSVLDPPDGIGRYATEIFVSQADEGRRLPLLASWHRRNGTLPNPRFPIVAVEDRPDDPLLIQRAGVVDLADVIEVGNLPTGLSANDVRLSVNRITEVIGADFRRIEFGCGLARRYEVGLWNESQSPTSSRWTSSRTTLAAPYNAATDATISLAVGGRLWTTDPAHFPLDLDIDGIRVRVLGITGGGSPQTAAVGTVINAVIKTVPAGKPVTTWNETRWGL